MWSLRSFKTDHVILILISLGVTLSSGDGPLEMQSGAGILPPRLTHARYNPRNWCSNDSPWNFVQLYVNPVLDQLFDETKLYFAMMMDGLEVSFKDAENHAEVVKGWDNFMSSLSESLDASRGRIDFIWSRIVEEHEGFHTPWDNNLSPNRTKTFTTEYLFALQDEMQILEIIIRMGTREIFGSIQVNVMKVMGFLEEKTKEFQKHQGWDENSDKDQQALLEHMESSLKEVDQNLLGKVIAGLFRRARADKAKELRNKGKDPSEEETFLSPEESLVSFLRRPLHDLIVLTETYLSFPPYWRYWEDMTRLMREDLEILSRDEILAKWKEETLQKDIVIVLGPK